MSSLPADLAVWSAVLAGFAPDLAAPIGVLARRLDLVIGRVRARPRPHGDDPDGYDGLDRRGPYDRLVLSEWALADAVPEEFDRRAASGEQSFLRLDRRDRSKGVRCVALFDGGPDQLGGPRVVQLAAMVVLWRRALTSGADFSWGALRGASAEPPLGTAGQGTARGLPPALCDTVDRASIQGFLGARSGHAATTAEILAARAHIGEVDELWIIGSPAPDPLIALAPRAGQPAPLQLTLMDVIAPELRAVDVTLTRGGSTLGEARLDLPSPALTRRLLVDPFAELIPTRTGPTAPPPSPSTVWRPFPRGFRDPLLVRFVPGTKQLVCVLAGGVAFSWGFEGKVLKSPKPRQHALPDEPLVALGYYKQRVVAITRTKQGALRTSWDGATIPLARVTGPPPADGAGTLLLVAGVVLFLDVAGSLYVIEADPRGEKRVRGQGLDIALLFAANAQHVLYVSRGERGLVLKKWRSEPTMHFVANLDGDSVWLSRGGDVLLTHGAGGPHGSVGPRGWLVPSLPPGAQRPLGELAVPPLRFPSSTILGAASVTWNDVRAVTYDAAAGTMFHPGTEVTITLPRVPIEPTLSQDGSIVAWRTDEGFVEAWSFVTGAPVLQRHGG